MNNSPLMSDTAWKPPLHVGDGVGSGVSGCRVGSVVGLGRGCGGRGRGLGPVSQTISISSEVVCTSVILFVKYMCLYVVIIMPLLFRTILIAYAPFQDDE